MRIPFDYAVRNLGRSPLRLALAVSSAALVATLAIAGAGFVRGMEQALGTSSVARNVMVLGAGSEESLERSEISPQVATIVAADVDGIRTEPEGDGGVPFVSPEVHVALPLGKRDDGSPGATVIFRGVTPTAFLVHPQVRIVEGRAPEPGTDEVLLGTEALERLRRAGIDASVGATLPFERRPLPIVGVFAAPSTVMNGEIWMPLMSLKNATQRTTDSCVVITLARDGDPADLEAFAAMRVDLELSSMTESAYYAALSRFLAPVRWLVIATATIIALGGLLGGVGTMDAAFASRLRELGTLQSLGFRRRSIVASFMQESLLVAMSGALIAASIALVAIDGLAVRSTMGTFSIVVDSISVGIGFLAALTLGVIGSLIPAVRCLRVHVPDALKSSA